MLVAISTICQIGIEGLVPQLYSLYPLHADNSVNLSLFSLFNQSITIQTSSMIFRIISPSYHACGKYAVKSCDAIKIVF